MMGYLLKLTVFFLLAWLFSFAGCNKIDEFDQDPELHPIQQGFKASAAIGYCASLATMAFEGKPLPDNVSFAPSSGSEFSSSGLLYVNIDSEHPLPFNDHIGQIVIGGVWDNTDGGGVISILFGDFHLPSAGFKLYGIHTVPIVRQAGSDQLMAVFAEQDIVVGEGSDTIVHVGLSRIAFNTELERLNSEQPSDAFAAVKQNVWFVNINQNNTYPEIYDDYYEINGGGQIMEASSSSGGIMYHALIKSAFNYGICRENPLSGTAFIQNIKAGSGIDLGNIFLDFHSSCDGKAKVNFSTGKYFSSNGQHVNLSLN